MCGITGVMSSILNAPEIEAFKDLLNVSSLRGFEGSGLISAGGGTVREDPTVRILKSPHISGWLAYSPNFEELLRKTPPSVLIGHARWPTRGGNDKSALHPHRSKHIVGVHNGTMWEIAGTKVPDGKSDSALFFQAIADKGIEEAWRTSSGAACLVYVDEEDQTVNFIKNSQRPLHFRNYGWAKNISTLFWASEREMLEFVVPRRMKQRNSWDTYLPDHKLMSYPLDPHSIMEATVTDLTPKVSVPVSRGNFGTGWAWDDDWAELDQAGKDDATDVPFSVVPNRQRLIEDKRAQSAGPFPIGNQTSREGAGLNELSDQINDLFNRTHKVHKGCAWCGEVPAVGDFIFKLAPSDLGNNEFLCDDCGKNPDTEVFRSNATRVPVIN